MKCIENQVLSCIQLVYLDIVYLCVYGMVYDVFVGGKKNS